MLTKEQQKEIGEFIIQQDRYLVDIADKFGWNFNIAQERMDFFLEWNQKFKTVEDENGRSKFTVKLLPGEIRNSNYKYICFLCKEEKGIFEQNSYGDYCVCHHCVIVKITEMCRAQDNNQ